VVLITKCGHGKDFMLPLDDFEGMVRRELAQSLESLGTESIDLYLLHRDNPRLPVGKVLEVLNREIETGRIMAFGASNWTYHRITEADAYARKHGLKGFSTISNNISLAVPAGPFYPGLVSVDEEGEKWHRKSRVPLISWSSLARGFFTGCYTPATATSSPAGPAGSGDFAERPENAFERRMAEVYCTDENFQRLDRARQVGERKGGYTPAETALAWVLNRPYPVLAAVGPHTQEHLESCVKASHLALSADEMDYLRSGGP